MKVNKLLCFAIPLMLLGGCGTDTTADKPNKKVESSETKKEKLTKETYPIKITSLSSDFKKELSELQKIALSDEIYKEKKKEANKKIDDLQKMTVKFKNLEAPKEYEDIQKDIIKVMDIYDEGFKLQKEAVSTSDKDKMQQSIGKFEEGKKSWNEVYAKMVEIQATLAGEVEDDVDTSHDGTVNLSEDGKELMGKWGTRTKDGKFDVNLVFNQDGTYDGYDDGKYPSKTDYFNGNWKYDSKTHMLHLSKKEFYIDGKLQNGGKDGVKFEVKYFNEGKVELIETETKQSMKFEKE